MFPRSALRFADLLRQINQVCTCFSHPVSATRPKVGLPRPAMPSSLSDKRTAMKPVKVSWLVLSKPDMPQTKRYPPGRNEENPMNLKTLSALAVVTSLATASSALAQDAAAGKTSFNKCLACHAIGEGARTRSAPSSTASTAATPAPRRTTVIPMPTRIPASPGTRKRSSNTSRIRRPRFPAPRWPSPASRTRPRPTICGPTCRRSTRTASRSKAARHSLTTPATRAL